MNLRKHLTYANVVSTTCLFLALGGVAYAGDQLAKGSVGVNQLKAEAVTKPKLHANSVNSKKVVDGSLTGSDIDASTLGKVPNASNADHATSADTATSASNAGTATNADHATSADTAVNAEKLDGHTPAEFGPVLVSSGEIVGSLEGEWYFSVTGYRQGVSAESLSRIETILPGHHFRATDFAFHLEGNAQASVSVRASLVVNGTPQEACTLTVVPGTCTSSTPIEIPAGAQIAWKVESTGPVSAWPEFALRLLPG